MLRFGNVSEVDGDKCLVRVEFDDDGVVSFWLPVLQPRTQKDKFFYVPDVGEHVACVMDEHAENGVVLGALYSEAEAPGATKGADKVGVAFESGDLIEYDRAAQKLRVKTDTTELIVEKTAATIKADQTQMVVTSAGATVKKGTESLKTILSDLIDAILAETHVDPQGGVTGTPVNAAQYTAIKTRINGFFEA